MRLALRVDPTRQVAVGCRTVALRILPRASLSDRLDFYNRGRTQPRQKERGYTVALLRSSLLGSRSCKSQRLLRVATVKCRQSGSVTADSRCNLRHRPSSDEAQILRPLGIVFEGRRRTKGSRIRRAKTFPCRSSGSRPGPAIAERAEAHWLATIRIPRGALLRSVQNANCTGVMVL